MRKALILQLGALSYALTLVNCYAQLSMGITADKKIYLQYEPIELTITIENNSGNTLTFDKTDPKKPASSYIRCIVEGEDHERVKETGDAIKRFGKGNLNMAAGFILPAGGKRSLKVQVNRFYKMSQAQTYSIQVYVRHKRFGKDFISKPANVSIVNGVPVVS